MKKIFVLAVVSIFACSVQASNLFQSDNPFPQTSPQSLNNVYESAPATMQDEVKKEKKSWFRKGRNLQDDDAQKQLEQHKFPVYPVTHEGVQSDTNFYMFSTGK